MYNNMEKLLCFITLFLSQIQSLTYHQNKVYRLHIDRKESIRNLTEFYQLSKDVLDYWHIEGHVGGAIDVKVSPSTEYLISHPLLSNINISLEISDVQDFLDEVEPRHSLRYKRSNNINRNSEFRYDQYNSAASINKELYRLSQLYPHLTRLISIGKTHAKRTLVVMEITGIKGVKRTKPMVWVDGGIHAREWITVSSCMYLIKQLLEGYGHDNNITDLMDSIKFSLQPLSNPDGYVYSWLSERLWRKNRSPTIVPWCKGVDLNRNFDIDFGGSGASNFSCSEIYKGSNPFSELETESMAKYLATMRHRLLAYFSLHSFGQLWLTPLSYTNKSVQDRKKHLSVADHATTAIRKVTGKRYAFGPATELMYVTSGDSSDWVYENLNCSHAYGIELRDVGRYKFVLPESQIIPTGQDTVVGILSATQYILDQPEGSQTTLKLKLKEQSRRRRKSKKQKHQAHKLALD